MAVLSEIASKLRSVDPAQIRKTFPDRQDYEACKAAYQVAAGLLEEIDAHGLRIEMLTQIEQCSNSLRQLNTKLADSTELGSKTRLNQAVLWTEAGYYERSIFLAGLAQERSIREPYRTQLALQPANACLARYRQTARLDRWIRENLSD